MSADDAARQEAERRYPFDAPDTYHSDAERMQRSVFIQGERTGWIDHAAWQREQPVTDAEVEAALAVMDEGEEELCTCQSYKGEKHKVEPLCPERDVVREILRAAKGASNG